VGTMLAAGTRQLLFERSTPYKVMEGQLLSVMADSSSISAVRAARGGDEPQLGIDGVEVAHARSVDPRGGVSR
jgi:hypothetical protein